MPDSPSPAITSDAPTPSAQPPTSPTTATPPATPTSPTPPEPPTIPHAAPSPNPPDPNPQREAFHRQWWDTVRRELETTPDLTDEKSTLGQALQSILRETSLYSLTPDGFRQAAELARARHTAAAVPALQSKLDALTRENERLVKLTSVTGSGPARLTSTTPGDYNERELRRLAADHDNS